METHNLATFRGYPHQTYFDTKKKICGIVTDGSVAVGDEIQPFYKLESSGVFITEILETRKAAGDYPDGERPNFFKVGFQIVKVEK